MAMIGTVDISSDIKWHEQELWILLWPTIGNDVCSGFLLAYSGNYRNSGN